MNYDQLARGILVSGADDWVSLGEITCQLGPGLSDQEILGAALEVIRRLLEPGWMEIGDLSPQFVARGWTAARAVGWIEQEWHRLGASAQRDYMCWFANTPAGEDQAQKLGAQ